MDHAAPSVPGNARKKRRFVFGVKGFMVVVASCAFIIWSGLSILDHLKGRQPLSAIRSGNAIERQIAANDLSNPQRGIGTDEAVAALINTLRDEDAGVRAEGARSLALLVYQLNHQPGPPVVPDLITRRNDVATRGLVSLLSDRDSSVRSAAATSLGTVAKRPSPGPPTPELLAALRDRSNAVRRHAASMIYGVPEVTLPPELVAALQDESAEVRGAAAQALVQFGPDLDPQIPALMAMLEHGDTFVLKARSEALEAAWPSPALVPTLTDFLRNRDRSVRFHAAQLLGRIGPEAKAAIPDLIALLKEPIGGSSYQDPARGAARALGQMSPGREAIAVLIEVISPEKIEANLAALQKAPQALKVDLVRLDLIRESLRITSAIEGLGDIGPPAIAAVPALIAAYNMSMDRHSMAQTAIPAALGRIAPNSAAAPDAVAILNRALDSRDTLARNGAVEALGQFGIDAALAIPRLRALKDDPYNTLLRDVAAKSLAAIEVQSKPDAKANMVGEGHKFPAR